MASSNSKAVWKSKWLNGEKHKINLMMNLSDDDENMVFPLHGLGRRSKRNKFRSASACGLSRVVKDVFSSTSSSSSSSLSSSSAKKRRSKKIEEWSSSSPQSSSSSLSSKIQKALTFKKTPSSSPSGGYTSPSDGHTSPTSSLFSSSLMGSSSSSSSLSNSCSGSESYKPSRSQSERKLSDLSDLSMVMIMNPLIINISNNKSFKKKCGEQNENYIGLYFLVIICLVGLVFSGKAFAIFCTATGLFFIPRRPEINLQIRASRPGGPECRDVYEISSRS